MLYKTRRSREHFRQTRPDPQKQYTGNLSQHGDCHVPGMRDLVSRRPLRARSRVSFAPFLPATLVLALAALVAPPLAAHDLCRSEARLEVRGREVRAAFTFNLLDFPGVDQNGDKRVTDEEFNAAFDRVYAAILSHYSLDSSGPPSRLTRDRYRLFDEH